MLTTEECSELYSEIEKIFRTNYLVKKFLFSDDMNDKDEILSLQTEIMKTIHKFHKNEDSSNIKYYVVSMVNNNEVGSLHCSHRLFEAESEMEARLKFTESYPPDCSLRIVRIDLFKPATEYLYKDLNEEYLIIFDDDESGNRRYLKTISKSEANAKEMFRNHYPTRYVVFKILKIRSLTEEQRNQYYV